MEGRDKARMAVYAMGGIYLLVLAYQMLTSLGTAGDDRMLMIIFIIVFALAGGVMVFLGARSTYLSAKTEREQIAEDIVEDMVEEDLENLDEKNI